MFLQRSWVCSTSSALFTIMMHLMHSNRPYELRMILMHHMILRRFQPFHLSVTLLSSEYTSIGILIFTLLNLIPLQLAKLILRLLIVLNIIESMYYSISPPDKSGTCCTTWTLLTPFNIATSRVRDQLDEIGQHEEQRQDDGTENGGSGQNLLRCEEMLSWMTSLKFT